MRTPRLTTMLTSLALVSAITLNTGCESGTEEPEIVTYTVDGETDADTDSDTDADADADTNDGPSRESNDDDGDGNQGHSAIYCADVDGDGYGDPNQAIAAESVSNGYVADCTDCDDDDATIYAECDGVIWYLDADGDGYGVSTTTTTSETQPSGYVSNASDCDDTNTNVNPGHAETAGNGLNDDCNSATSDSTSSTTWYYDADGDGYGTTATTTTASTQPTGYVSNASDCNDASAAVSPADAEVTGNGIDDDCNSATSDTAASTWYRDADGDGYGTSSTTTSATTQPSGYVSNSSDCDDSTAAVSPVDVEVTGNGIDDDCNSATSDTAATSSLVREVCVTSSTSAYRLAYYDDGNSDRTHWVTEVSGTATVVSPILTGSSGTTGCVSVTLQSEGTVLCFNGYGSDSQLWGDYLVGAYPGSGSFAYSSGTTSASEVKITVDSTVNSSSDSSAETATFDANDLCWAD